jgi:hypothetical protein
MRHFLPLILFAFPGLAAARSPARADESNFVVLPITTELQRSAMGYRPGARAYVLINGKGLVEDSDTVRWKALDFDALRRALQPLKAGRDAVVIFHIFHDAINESDAPRLLRWALIGFGREAGFRDALAVTTHAGGFDWEKHLAAINARIKGGPDADEPAVGTDAVKVSPVRTALSRHLFANADCVVTLTKSFDEHSDGSLQPEVEKAIRTHVANLKLADKGKLLFRIRHKQGGEAACERFHQTTAKELAEALGFDSPITQNQLER